MSKWSLNAKIYFILGVLITGSLFIAAGGIVKLAETNEALNRISGVNFVNIQQAFKVKEAYYDQIITGKNLLIVESPEQINKYYQGLSKGHEKVLQTAAKLKETLIAKQGHIDLQKFVDIYQEWFKTANEVKILSLAGQIEEAKNLGMGKLRDLSNGAEDIVNIIIQRNSESVTVAVKQAGDDYILARNTLFIILAASLILGFSLAFYVLRSLGKSISQVVESLTDGSNQVTSASQQIAASSEELSQAATEQAASLEETASSIEEMNSMVQKNSENAKRTSELSISSNQSAERGKTVVQDMIKAIDDISISNANIMEQVNQSNEKISHIVKVIAEIGEKTKVINDIVFQTKLLSFNASVEAARAGEHGKGFAVVAEEVGNLAAMSGNAAKEISSMLEESMKEVESIVTETKEKVGSIIQDGKLKVEVGTKVAHQCGSVLEEIVSNVSSVTEMANEISTACQEQASGVQEITKAMNQLDQVTQTNAATSEETASAAEELSSQSESLRSTVEHLIKEVYGSNKKSSAKTVTAVKSPVKDNVVHIQTKSPPPSTEIKYKKVSGGYEGQVPVENDPRFEDV